MSKKSSDHATGNTQLGGFHHGLAMVRYQPATPGAETMRPVVDVATTLPAAIAA